MAKVTEEATYTIELGRAEVKGLYGLVACGVSAAALKDLGLSDLYVSLRGILGGSSEFDDFFVTIAHV
jgi:hypothetical protein